MSDYCITLLRRISEAAMLLCIGLLMSGLPTAWAGEVEIVTVEVDGTGIAEQDAVLDAINRAIGQVNGISVKSNTHSVSGKFSSTGESQSSSVTVAAARVDVQEKGELQVRSSTNGSAPTETRVNSDFKGSASMQGVAVTATESQHSEKGSYAAMLKDISAQTQGQVKTFEVLSSQKTEDGYRVRVAVSIVKFVLSQETKRLRIAVIPFRISTTKADRDDAAAFEREFSRQIVSALTQSRKFAVLDRDFVREQSSELGGLESGQVPIEELAKLGNKLGTDLLLVGVLEELVARRNDLVLQSTGEKVPMIEQGARISYRLVSAATGQIRYSDSYDSIVRKQGGTVSFPEVAALAGQIIAEQVLMTFYPIMVESVEGGTVVLGLGGSNIHPGQRYRLIQYGSEIIDSYTQESLGRSENDIGVVEIIDVQTKLSRARVIRTTINLADNFYPREFIVRPVSRLPQKGDFSRRVQILEEDARKRAEEARIAKEKRFKELEEESKKAMDKLKKQSDDDW